ncbi:TPA: prepilin-type N-terminal cleavage/methylation domain-containing protein, partial [Escherichia coli]
NPPQGDDNTVEAISAISGIPTIMAHGTKMFTTPSGQWVQFWTGDNNTYVLETQVQSVSSCISYATLNMGTIMARKTEIHANDQQYGGNSNSGNST